tara:strand:- start:343 stop:495 length:153 start_codon:yes stop_codon:yes gene_type:complete
MLPLYIIITGLAVTLVLMVSLILGAIVVDKIEDSIDTEVRKQLNAWRIAG